MGSAICGGNHYQIKTIKAWREHIRQDVQNGLACLDCWCGIPPALKTKKKPKK